MSPRERLGPVRMDRVALVAPVGALRSVLVEVADAGVVELDAVTENVVPAPAPATAGLRAAWGSDGLEPRLAREAPDESSLAADHEPAVLAGEAELARKRQGAVVKGRVAALLGWAPERTLEDLRARVAPHGGAVVALARPVGVEPPTLLAPRGVAAPFRPLVDIYGTVRYTDVDPTPFAAIAFAVMFGMMFGDVGHGVVLVMLALRARTGRGVLGRFRAAWPLGVAAGAVAVVFGVAYGELFGPTGALPALWLRPLDDPMRLLVAGVVVGAVLLGASEVIATINRWREGGFARALYDRSAIAGLCWFAGLGLLGSGLAEKAGVLALSGAVVLAAGTVLVFVGSVVGGGGIGQAVVESFDGILRLGSNLVSFARLAAFGLTHAAITLVVWDGTTALWHPSPSAVGAVLLFAVGNALAFALELLVVGVQALRLEYYELFSRIFGEEGRPFRPWHIPLDGRPSEAS